MSGHGRRSSARLADKEDVPIANGIDHGFEQVKQSQKGPSSGKSKMNGAKVGLKRKPGEFPCSGCQGLKEAPKAETSLIRIM